MLRLWRIAHRGSVTRNRRGVLSRELDINRDSATNSEPKLVAIGLKNRRNLAGINHGSPICNFLDGNRPRGNRLTVGGIRLPLRTGSTLSRHKLARLDVGRHDLACGLGLPIRALSLPAAARAVR
jgi:hypothetical protein